MVVVALTITAPDKRQQLEQVEQAAVVMEQKAQRVLVEQISQAPAVVVGLLQVAPVVVV